MPGFLKNLLGGGKLNIKGNARMKSFLLTLAVFACTFIVVGLVLAWTNPTTTPPGGNILAPINVGSGAQTKTGALTVMGSLSVGTTTVISSGLAISGNTNICHLVTYTAGSGTTYCPTGYYTWSGLATTTGQMLCCKVDNPI